MFWPALSEKASYQSKMLDLGSQNSLLQHAVCPNFWYFCDFLNTVRLTLYILAVYLADDCYTVAGEANTIQDRILNKKFRHINAFNSVK